MMIGGAILSLLATLTLQAPLMGGGLRCESGCAAAGGRTTFMMDALKPFVDSGELPGGISILERNGEQEICCIGYSDVDAKRPIGLDDVFMQCSQTKGFCGVTIAKLVEEGKLELDDPISKYLPEFKTLWVKKSETNGVQTLVRAKNVLTVRMCLNHTGGFPFEVSGKANTKAAGGGWTCLPLRETAKIAAASPLLFEPGTKVQYSNTGIDIGANVVAIVSGMPWEEYLRKTVLDPLGMKSTGFWPTDEQLKTQIELYLCRPKEKGPAKRISCNGNQQRPYNGPTVFPSAGAGLWTTANDQYRFYKMLMNLGVGDNGVRVLKEETVKCLLALSTRPKGLKGYSLGLLAPVVDSEEQWFGHGGAFGTYAFINWHKKCLKIWIAQLNGGPRPWCSAVDGATEKFFKMKLDTGAEKSYTGRLN